MKRLIFLVLLCFLVGIWVWRRENTFTMPNGQRVRVASHYQRWKWRKKYDNDSD